MKKLLTKQQVFYEVPDFPKAGINFLDIQKVFHDNLAQLLAHDMDCSIRESFDVIVAPDSRGFLLGPLVSCSMERPLVLVRKKGKLPPPVCSVSYDTEYSSDMLEVSSEYPFAGKRVLIVDDILATGGTFKAIKTLVESKGAKVVEGLFLASVGLFNEEIDCTISVVY